MWLLWIIWLTVWWMGMRVDDVWLLWRCVVGKLVYVLLTGIVSVVFEGLSVVYG